MSAQVLLAFDEHPADAATGFALGWDHACHDLLPPAALMQPGNPLWQGYQAAQRAGRAGSRAGHPGLGPWLALRRRAWLGGCGFETLELNPRHLASLARSHCPVSREPLDPARLAEDLVRLRPDCAWAAGHLAVLAPRVRAALGRRDAAAVQALLQGLQAEDLPEAEGLSRAEWQRLAALLDMVRPLPQAEALARPLSVLPPPRLRLLNPAHGLQALIAWQYLRPGFSARIAQIEAALPTPALRARLRRLHFALLPRVLEAAPQAEPEACRHAVEDAWHDPRVQQAWSLLGEALGEAGCAALLDRLAERARLDGLPLQARTLAQATEGWAPAEAAMPLPSRLRRLPGPRPALRLPTAESARRPQPAGPLH
ncbi:hypothetical protein JI742_11890 [Piscinibacter sp. Jin2]|uniref:Uncharacterized protein n=1 Tax=Aquariibacter lacus TaxID=2801332 RepID=A0A9X1BNV5_9BURK|nr:hypothetical protein [Piscinibacter lacus]MBL0720585.1 hypothetical protein [Piscinibacter lacus]